MQIDGRTDGHRDIQIDPDCIGIKNFVTKRPNCLVWTDPNYRKTSFLKRGLKHKMMFSKNKGRTFVLKIRRRGGCLAGQTLVKGSLATKWKLKNSILSKAFISTYYSKN